ncbi:MAG: hypothetical protein R3C11_23400 [Planctomycetaceae bacterium]
MSLYELLKLTQKLITFESTSCYSNVVVTDYVDEQLQQSGFVTERINYNDANGVAKSCGWEKRKGVGGLVTFAHSDVVPANPWYVDSPSPFEPSIVGDKLYGQVVAT